MSALRVAEQAKRGSQIDNVFNDSLNTTKVKFLESINENKIDSATKHIFRMQISGYHIFIYRNDLRDGLLWPILNKMLFNSKFNSL